MSPIRKHYHLLIIALSFVLTSCNPINSSKINEDLRIREETLTFAYAHKSSTSPFWTSLMSGAKDAASELNITLLKKGPVIENDATGQMDVIDTFISMEVDALMVAPCDSQLLNDPIKKVISNNIPVITVDTDVTNAQVLSHIGTNNYEASKTVARWIVE